MEDKPNCNLTFYPGGGAGIGAPKTEQTRIIPISQLKDPDDPQGRTILEVNLDIKPSIPIGTLVEIVCEPDIEDYTGVRLYVVWHGRDCDGTPLYWLSADKNDTVKNNPLGHGLANFSWVGAFSVSSLRIVT